MTDSPLREGRYARVARRAFLTRSLGVGAAVALGGVLTACGHDDQATLGTATAGDAGGATTPAPPNPAPPTTEPPTTAPSTTTAPPTTAPTGAALPAGSHLDVRFTYTASGGGRVNNPYLAVWIEDADEQLVATVALWYLQSQKGLRYLDELRRWYEVGSSSDVADTASGASHPPGEYAVSWDGRGLDGKLVATGDYFVCIEAAREHGPHSLIRRSITIGDTSFTTTLDDDGELHGASAALVVA